MHSDLKSATKNWISSYRLNEENTDSILGTPCAKGFFYLEISETAADADVVTRGLNAQEMEVAGREVFIVHKALQSLSSG